MGVFMHIINGRVVNLRCRSNEEIRHLVTCAEERLERVQEELDSLKGGLVRRSFRVVR